MNELGLSLTLLAVALVAGIVLREVLVWRRRRDQEPQRRVGFYADSGVADPRLKVSADVSDDLPAVDDGAVGAGSEPGLEPIGDDPWRDLEPAPDDPAAATDAATSWDEVLPEPREAADDVGEPVSPPWTTAGPAGEPADAEPTVAEGDGTAQVPEAPVGFDALEASALEALRVSPGQPDLPPIIPQGVDADGPGAQGELFMENAAPAGAPADSELIVALHVLHPEGTDFPAQAVQAALGDAGLQFGEMRIYHHPGLGNDFDRRGVFSVAKAVEPGSFDPRNRASFKTPGLVFFAQLPGQQDGLVILELMLAAAERVARRLGGLVLDQHRVPLSAESVARLRESVAGFELDRQMRVAREDR